MKRVLSMLIAVIMVVSMIPAMTFMSLADDPMGVPGQVYVCPDVDSTWHPVGPETPVQAIGTNGAYEGSYDPMYNNASVMGVIFEVAGVDSAITLSTNSFKADVTSDTSGNSQTSQIYSGYDKKTAGGDAIDADGIYVYLAQPMWWSQWGGKLFCAALNDISFVTSANCSMRILGIVEVPQLETAESDRSTYIPNLSSEIKFVDTDKTTELGTQTSTIATGWEHGWGGSLVKKLDAISTEYAPETSEDDTYRYEFDGWKTVDTDASVECAAGQFTVYPSIKATSLTSVTVTFKNGLVTVDTQIVERGDAVVYGGPTPEKAEDNDNIYVFRGWKDENGDIVDLDTYTTQVDATLTADYATIQKTKVTLVEKTAVGFNKAGTYGLKINRSDITLDTDGNTAPIASGSVTVTCDVITNEIGENEFAVTFDTIDETGMTNAEFKLVPPENSSSVYSVKLTGNVTGEAGAMAEIYETSESLSTVGEQLPGRYYGEDAEVVALNKNDGDMPPAEQTVWADNVYFGSAQTGITFVMKATGIETPVELVRIDTGFVNAKGADDYFNWHWFYNNPFWGSATTSSRSLAINNDGYYLLYIDNRLFDGNKISAVKSFSVFTNKGAGASGGTDPEKVNNNENAALQMIAVVGGNLQPTVTFHDANGDVITSKQYQYTNVVGMTNDGNEARQSMPLVSAADIFNSIEEAELPVKTPEAGKEYLRYDFAGWAYEDGTPADAVYMNADVYPVYDVVDTRPDCTIKFMNGDAVYETQIVKEGEYPVAPAVNPTKPSTDDYSYIFQGWDADGDGNVDELAVATTAGATYTAVYEQVDRRWEIKYYAEDKETYLGSLYVLGEIEDGTEPTAPVKPADVQYTYTFDKWVFEDGSELVKTEVTEDTAVYATYTATLNKYTVTFLDEDGKELDKVTVDYGTAATTDEPTKASDELYSYKFAGWDADTSNVVGDMTVKATYTRIFSKFTDVAPDAWYAKQVEYVVVNNYFSGMSPTTFEPQTKATRAMVVRVLYSAAGSPSVEELTTPFNDVPAGEWYSNAVTWAYNAGVVFGMSDTEFAPNASVRREEFCAFLHRYAEKVHLIDGKNVDMTIPTSDITSSLSTFKDRNDIDLWAHAAVKWCKYAKIVQGTKVEEDTYFYPQNGLTRAELATMIKGFFESDKLVPLA